MTINAGQPRGSAEGQLPLGIGLAGAAQDDSDGDGLGDACDPWTTVSYHFSGFLAPVANAPLQNAANAGALILQVVARA